MSIRFQCITAQQKLRFLWLCFLPTKFKKFESFQNVKKEEIKEVENKSDIDEQEIELYNKKINSNLPIEKLREYCELKENKDNIKLVDKQSPINNDINLIDLSIAIKGPEEEKHI